MINVRQIEHSIADVGHDIVDDAQEGYHHLGPSAPFIIGAGVLLLYFFLTRNKTVAATSSTASTTGTGTTSTDGTSGSTTNSTDATQIAAGTSLAQQFSTLLTNAFGGLNTKLDAGYAANDAGFQNTTSEINTLGNTLAANATAQQTQYANMFSTGVGNLASLVTAGSTAEQNGFAATGSAVSALGSDIQNEINASNAATKQATDTILSGVNANTGTLANIANMINTVINAGTQIYNAVNTQAGATDQAIANSQVAIAAKIDAGNQAQVAQLTTLSSNLSGLLNNSQTAITSAISAIGTKIDSFSSTYGPNINSNLQGEYYNIGAHSLAACYDNGGISVNCAEDQGRYEAGTNDVNQTWIKNYLTTTYSSCLANGKFDAVCVGKQIVNGTTR